MKGSLLIWTWFKFFLEFFWRTLEGYLAEFLGEESKTGLGEFH
jgi:hypothetical protein